MPEGIVQAIILTIALLIVLAVAVVGISLYSKSKSMVGGASSQVDSLNKQLDEAKFSDVPHAGIVKGSNVISSISNFATAEFPIIVVTSAVAADSADIGFKNTVYRNGIYGVSNPNNNDFIEATSEFKVIHRQTPNQVLNQIEFIQIGADGNPAYSNAKSGVSASDVVAGKRLDEISVSKLNDDKNYGQK